MASERAAILATEHWGWLMVLLEEVYTGAFIHGYKHGQEDKEEVRKANQGPTKE